MPRQARVNHFPPNLFIAMLLFSIDDTALLLSISVQVRPPGFALLHLFIQRCGKQPCHDQRNLSEKREVFGVVEREPLGTR